MKILMIAPEPFLEPRGTPVSIYQRVTALSSLGHQIDLLTYHLGQDINVPGVEVYRIVNVPFIKSVRVGPSWSKLILDILIFFHAFIMLARGNYGAIHTHEEAAFFSVVLAGLFHTAHVYDMHSSLPRQLDNFSNWNHRLFVKLFSLLERWTVNTSDAVITISPELGAYVRTMNPDTRCVVIENLPIQVTVNASHVSSVGRLREKLSINGKLPVVYTGNFEHYQGIDLLVDSIDLVKERHPNVIFVIVGGQPQQVTHWENEVRRRQLTDCALFVGSVPLDEVGTYLELAEILVSPRLEGTFIPLKIYSYLLSGKPTLATNIPSHTQVLNEDIAKLVAPIKEAFADGLSSLILNPGLRLQLGQRARKYVEERNIAVNYTTKLQQLYTGLEQSRKLSARRVSPTTEKP